MTTHGNPFKLFKEHNNVNGIKSFFSQRIINVLNSLSSGTVDFRSVRKFKRTINLSICHHFLHVFSFRTYLRVHCFYFGMLLCSYAVLCSNLLLSFYYYYYYL